jgi:hypothetical protein
MRASLALDLMEPIRPEVDSYLFDLIDGHVFRAGDFRETRTGVCRINPPLTHHLAETLDLWYDLAAPIVEETIRILTDGEDTDTHLTQNNRRKGQGQSPPESDPPQLIRTHCLECGNPTTESQKLCDPCRDAKRGQARLQRLAELRAKGHDPAHGGEAAKQRGASNRKHQQAVAEWNADNQEPDPKEFQTQILPGLQQIKIERIAEATGLTPGYCSFIRRGINTPHPRHWPTLTQLIDETATQEATEE